jgi:hypothetical protein
LLLKCATREATDEEKFSESFAKPSINLIPDLLFKAFYALTAPNDLGMSELFGAFFIRPGYSA